MRCISIQLGDFHVESRVLLRICMFDSDLNNQVVHLILCYSIDLMTRPLVAKLDTKLAGNTMVQAKQKRYTHAYMHWYCCDV